MRIRVTFSKTGSLRYIGHLDLQQVWERTARRAGLPLAYTQGFHPGPRIQIAAALPLGFSGRAEVVDLWLQDNVGADLRVRPGDEAQRDDTQRDDTQVVPYKDLLQSTAPPGLDILSVEEVDEHSPALQTQVAAAEYEVTLLVAGEGSDTEAQVDKVLGAESLPRERRGKAYDLRPLILALECSDLLLRMTLSAREGATGRPEEVLAEIGIPVEAARVERTRLIFKNEIK